MRRRRLLQAALTLPLTPFLKAQAPVVQKPAPNKSDELPKLETANTDQAGMAVAPRYFGAPQFSALEKLCDVIAPASPAMPGALAAGVPAFLDFMISQSPPERQRLYQEGLDTLNQAAQKLGHSGFSEAAENQMDSLLAPLMTSWKHSGGEGQEHFLRSAKEDILEATANSREWIAAASKRNRSARGMGMYWWPIE